MKNQNNDYFEKIDTKDKAYWLGFLYADGCVQPQLNRIKIKISSKDEVLLQKLKQDLLLSNKIERWNSLSIIRVGKKKMVKDLEKNGCVRKKTKIIELPELDSRELYLAFLLGYFDGDGQQGKTKIITSSKKFLEQIKEKFHLPFSIRLKKKSNGIVNGRVVSGTAYEMCLGAELFNQMMDNYEDSLQRKRKHFCTNEERIERIKDNAWKGSHKKKLNMTKEELSKIVWEMPSTKIAEKYGVSGRLITKRCRQLGIEKPSRGYWAKKEQVLHKF